MLKSGRQKQQKRQQTQSDSKPLQPRSPTALLSTIRNNCPTPPRGYRLHKRQETPHPKAPHGTYPRTQRFFHKRVKPRTKLTPQREKLQILRRTTHSLRKERATTSVATKNSGKKGMTRTRTTRRGPKGPYNPHRRMREPHQPQQVKTKTGPRHTTGTYLPLGSAPINLETTIQSQHPNATTNRSKPTHHAPRC